MEEFSRMIAAALKLPEHRVSNTLKLLLGGATIPFISRYRKEATGGLDEVQIGEIQANYDKLTELAKRKETILSTIGEQGKLTDELRSRISGCWNPTELEDIYLPYKPKRKTRAEAARQKGLEPLAILIMLQRENNLTAKVRSFVKGEVENEEEALKGARDIIAEQVSENEGARNTVRNAFAREAVITAKVVKGKETEENAAKYRDYFDFSEPLKKCTSHRLLAIRRGESEGILKVSISPDDTGCTEKLERKYVKGNNECARQVAEAVADAYKRLIKPGIETEFAAASKEKADEEAIRVFAGNLRQLLLAPPLGQKRVLGIDPGYRTGCKVVCLDGIPAGGTQTDKACRTIQNRSHRHRKRNGKPGNGTVRYIPAFRPGNPGVCGQRRRGFHLFRIQACPRRISRLRRYRARSGVYRTQTDGSAGGAGEDRPEIHRRRAIPARCRPDQTESIARPDCGKLRQSGRSKREHRKQAPADIRFGTGTGTRKKHRRLPHGERTVPVAQGTAESAPHGSKSL